MDTDRPVTVVNLTLVRFIGGPTIQGRTGSIQGVWKPEILVAVITMVGVPLEESLPDIGMKSRNVLIRVGCDDKASWVRSLG